MAKAIENHVESSTLFWVICFKTWQQRESKIRSEEVNEIQTFWVLWVIKSGPLETWAVAAMVEAKES